VRYQFHDPTALPKGKEKQVPTEQKAERVQELAPCISVQKNLSPAGNRITYVKQPSHSRVYVISFPTNKLYRNNKTVHL